MLFLVNDWTSLYTIITTHPHTHIHIFVYEIKKNFLLYSLLYNIIVWLHIIFILFCCLVLFIILSCRISWKTWHFKCFVNRHSLSLDYWRYVMSVYIYTLVVYERYVHSRYLFVSLFVILCLILMFQVGFYWFLLLYQNAFHVFLWFYDFILISLSSHIERW